MSLSTTITIDRGPEDVFEYVTDPTRFGEWQRGVVSGSIDPQGPTGVGAKCISIRKIGFTERQVTSEVTHVDPPRTWGVRGIDGPIRAEVDVTVDPVDEGHRSRVTIEIDFTGHGIGKLLVPLLVRPQARKEMPANLQALKRNLETAESKSD